MIKLTILELLSSLQAKISNHDLKVDNNAIITGIELNSKKVVPGNIFVAIKGLNHDGHDYLVDAEKNGALCAIVDKINHQVTLPQLLVPNTRAALGDITRFMAYKWNKPKVSITGSNGKTTTKFILASILQEQGEVLCPKQSFNNEIGVPLTMFSASDDQWAGVFEIGTNHPGEIDYLTKLMVSDIAILTSVSQTHIGNFKDLTAIAHEKFDIFNNLKPGGTAIYYYDLVHKDVLIEKLSKLSDIKQLTFGFNDQADIWADEIVLGQDRTLFTLHYKQEDIEKSVSMELFLLGKHQVLNALAATGAALTLGLNIEQIKQGLGKVKPVSKRMQAIRMSKHAVIIDDSYNASPASVAAALGYLAECIGLKILVIGDLGELGDTAMIEHKRIGQLAKDLGVDIVFSLGDFSKYVSHEFYANNVSYSSRKYQEGFADKQELSNTVLRCLNDICQEDIPVTILIKGSNFMKMWEVTEKIIAEWPVVRTTE